MRQRLFIAVVLILTTLLSCRCVLGCGWILVLLLITSIRIFTWVAVYRLMCRIGTRVIERRGLITLLCAVGVSGIGRCDACNRIGAIAAAEHLAGRRCLLRRMRCCGQVHLRHGRLLRRAVICRVQ